MSIVTLRLYFKKTNSYSPNFPRASYLDERTLTYEPIVNCTPGNRASKMLVLSPDTGSNTKGFQVKQTL